MEGSVAIETNREALVRIVASLVAMARFPPPDASRRPPHKGEVEAAPTLQRPTVTRHVWRTILSLLRPAEAAARRLIIAAARGIVVPAPLPRKPAPQLKPAPLTARTLPNPADREAFLRRFGIAVTVSSADMARPLILPCEAGEGDHAQRGGGGEPSPPRIPAFPLFDPPRRLRLTPRRRYVPAHAAPRIMFPGITQPHRLPPPPPPPAPDDLISAAGVDRRLAALGAALEDLPGQARRFARLKARMDAQAAQDRAVAAASAAGASAPPSARRRFRRTYPLRGGPPYGGRLAVWDPTVPHGKHIREVDVILAHAHALADYALAFPDTS